MKQKKQEIIIWKYYNGDYVSHYLRFDNEKGHVAQPLNDEQLKRALALQKGLNENAQSLC